MKLSPLMPKTKKGQLGFDVVRNVMVATLIIVVIFIAVILAAVSLRDSGIFTAGGRDANQTTAIVNNVTDAGASFFGNMGTIFSILVVVVIILAIAIVIRVVGGFGRSGGNL